jgi:hypothetical protein
MPVGKWLLERVFCLIVLL